MSKETSRASDEQLQARLLRLRSRATMIPRPENVDREALPRTKHPKFPIIACRVAPRREQSDATKRARVKLESFLMSLRTNNGTAAVLSASPLMIGTVLRVSAQFIATVAATQFLGLQVFGYLAAALALSRLAAPLLGLGVRILFLKSSTYRAELSEEEYWWMLGGSRTAVSLVGASGIGAFCVTLFKIEFIDGFLIGLGLIPLLWLTLARTLMVRDGRIISTMWWEIARAVSILAPMVAFVGPDRSLRAWAVANAVAGAIFTLALIGYMLTILDGASAAVRLRNWSLGLNAGLTISIGLIAEAGSYQVDQVVLGAVSTAEATAIYGLAAAGAFAAMTPINALETLVLPRLLQSRTAEAERGYLLSTSGVLAISGLASVPAWWLLGHIFNEEFLRVGWLNLLLVIALAPRALALPMIARLHDRGMHRERSLIEATTLGANLVLNLVLIPELAYWGAIVATLCTEAIFGLSILGMDRRTTSTKRRVLNHSVSSSR